MVSLKKIFLIFFSIITVGHRTYFKSEAATTVRSKIVICFTQRCVNNFKKVIYVFAFSSEVFCITAFEM